MIETLRLWLSGSTMPVVSAVLMGLLAAMSPCALACSITAVGYLGRDISSRARILWNGALYTLGRALTYCLLAWTILLLLHSGAEVPAVKQLLTSHTRLILGAILLLMGVWMLVEPYVHLRGITINTAHMKLRGSLGALVIGMLLALAFCPYSGMLFFAGLIPMAAGTTGGSFLPIVFAIATAAPVLLVAGVWAFSANALGRTMGYLKIFQLWLNRIVAILFVLVGIYYTYTFFIS